MVITCTWKALDLILSCVLQDYVHANVYQKHQKYLWNTVNKILTSLPHSVIAESKNLRRSKLLIFFFSNFFFPLLMLAALLKLG